jgi:hypothetical protein
LVAEGGNVIGGINGAGVGDAPTTLTAPRLGDGGATTIRDGPPDDANDAFNAAADGRPRLSDGVRV